MTAIDRNNKQNQFYRKQARLSMKVFKFREFVTKSIEKKESLTYVTTRFPTRGPTYLFFIVNHNLLVRWTPPIETAIDGSDTHKNKFVV